MEPVRHPALFVPHGARPLRWSPGGRAALERLARSLPPPRAIVAVSAPLGDSGPTVARRHNSRPSTTSGLPRRVVRDRYPATGCPEAAWKWPLPRGRRVAVRLTLARSRSRAWVPLRLMFPRRRAGGALSSSRGTGRRGAAPRPRPRAAAGAGFLVVARATSTTTLGRLCDRVTGGHDTRAYVRGFADWCGNASRPGRRESARLSPSRTGCSASPPDEEHCCLCTSHSGGRRELRRRPRARRH